MIRLRYFVEVECDGPGCEAHHTFETTSPVGDPTPREWIHGSPPGEIIQRQFCSQKCLAAYQPNRKPWNEQ